MPMPVSVTLSGGQFVEETYEHPWIIPKWMEVSQRKDLLKKHAFIIKTDGKESKVRTTWRVEWKLIPVLDAGSPTKSCEVHWTLIDIKGMTGESLIAKIKTSVVRNYRDGPPDLDYQSDEQQRYFRLNEPVRKSFLWISKDVLQPYGDLSVQLNLTLVLPRKCYEDEMKSENNGVPKVAETGDNVPHIKVKKDKKHELEHPALCWRNEWHEADALGSDNLYDNFSQAVDDGGSASGAGAGTDNQAKRPCKDNGKKSGKSSSKKKQSKRRGKNDILVNQGQLKKIKLESDSD